MLFHYSKHLIITSFFVALLINAKSSTAQQYMSSKDKAIAEALTRIRSTYPENKNEFFELALSNHSKWWADWSRLVDNGLNTRSYASYVPQFSASYSIKKILEHDYKANVPFDNRQSFEAVSPSFVNPSATVRFDCAVVTPNLLAGTVSTRTAILAPGFMYPGSSAVEVRQQSQKLESHLLKLLIEACKDYPTVVPSLSRFLDDYSEVVSRMIEQRLATEKAAKDARIAAENQAAAEVAKREAAAKASLEAQRRQEIANAEAKAKADAEISKAAADKRQAARDKAREEQQIRNAQREEEQRRQAAAYAERQRVATAARNQHIADIKSGQAEVQTTSDAAILLDAKSGVRLIRTPPVMADNKPYVVRGILRRKQGNDFVFESIEAGGQYFYFTALIDSGSKIESGYELRFGAVGTVVGLFVGTVEFQTVGGETKNAPVFKALFVGP